MRNFRLHLVRHGMTDGNAKGQYLGCKTDSELSQRGMKELIDLRESYEYPAVGMVYSSPMARCIQTTAIVYPKRPLIVVPQLREMDFGDFEGQTIGDLKDNPDYLGWLADSAKVAPPGGENGDAFLGRVIEGIAFVLDDMMKSEIYEAAVVTHGGVIMTLLAAVGLPRKPMQEWMVGNGRGYTCFVNPQMWSRDGLIEVAGIMPHGADFAYANDFGSDGVPTGGDSEGEGGL